MFDIDEFRQRLEQIGQEEVKKQLLRQAYNQEKARIAQDWLDAKEGAREEAREERQESREEESVRLAREANEIALAANAKADKANSISLWSFIVASVGLLLSVVALLRGCSPPR